jgi:hypothetical protein
MKRFFHTATIGAGLVAGLTSSLSAQGAWPVIYKTTDVTVALDTGGATRNADGSFITRTRWDYVEARKLESKRPYTQMTEVALVKCTPVRIKRLTESFYSDGGAVVKEGTMPSPGEVQYMTWDRPKLRSDGARAFSNVCATLTKKAKAKARR